MHEHFNFHRTNRSFELHKWPKRHEFVIEECRCLNAGEILYRIPYENARSLRPWTPPGFPRLKLVPGRGGIFIKWWFLCPGCGQKRENLYIRPDGQPGDWQCRLCHSLVYSSQRYGQNNALRQILTPRKRRTRQKEAIRQNRKFAKQKKRQNRLDKNDPLSKEKMIPFLREFRQFIDSGKSLVIEVPRSHSIGPTNPAQNELDERSNEMANEAISDALKVVRDIAENSPSKRNRRRAQKMLDQFPPPQEVPAKKPSSGSCEYTEEELQKIIGAINSMHKKPKH